MDPLAIIGIGCRFPHAPSPRRFWELLARGEDAIDEVPAARWDAASLYAPSPAGAPTPGKMNTRWGGFVPDVDRFDARFFGISPAEAASIDPQQRWVLEVAHEAIEDAGIVAERLAGSKTGVFVGLSSGDYAQLLFADPSVVTMHSTPGGALSVVANRLSYVLDLRGPSLVIDTACSSSLVALVLAARSLWSAESELAIVAGVNVILSPAVYTSFAQAQATSPDGRCKAFDAAANGMVRGEGCGVVILKRLADAIADGDSIRAVLLGGAINQDGRTNGLTAPNRYGQEALLREAYASAGVAPSLVQYIEAHGTGTPLGDPIEAHALGAVVGAGRASDRPCRLGSVKTNIGHLEGAAGIAGVIKTVLALEHRSIPPSLHFRTPSPHIPFDDLRLRVETVLEPWPVGPDERALAGVSAFGFGGTNAHVVLEAYRASPVAATSADEGATPKVLTLSTRSPNALRELARATKQTLETDEALPLGDLCRTASLRRSHHEVRRALTFETRDELIGLLDDLGRDPNLVRARARPRKLAFVFPGMGSHRAGMGAGLLDEPVFAETIARCDRAMRPFQDFSIAELMRRAPESFPHDRGDVVQPLLFAFQIGLAALWRAWGLTPDAVIGGSVGEVAAAHVAGILDLDDACRIVCRRAQLLTGLAGRGTLAVVELSAAEAEAIAATYPNRVWIAASNGPALTLLAGERAELEEIVAGVEARGLLARLVKGAIVASHCPFVEPLRASLLDAIGGVVPRAGTIPMWSTVTAGRAVGSEMAADYWWRNMRQPVLFSQGIEALEATGTHTFLEIGAHAVMTSPIAQTVTALGREPSVVASIDRKLPERRAVREALGALYASGHAVSWPTVQPPGETRARLPSYPWARDRHWIVRDRLFPSTGGPTREAAPPTEPPAPSAAEPVRPADALATLSRSTLEAISTAEREARLIAYMRAHVARVLKMDLERLDVDEPLNHLGIGSLMGMDLNNRVKADLGVVLPVVKFLQGPSIREIAHEVLSQIATRPEAATTFPRAEPVRRELAPIRTGTFPMSFAQQRMWFLQRLAPESAYYTIPIALRFDGELDVAALEGSLREIVRRHESLRTTLTEIDGEPVQVVGPVPEIALRVTDLTALPEEAAFDEARRCILAETRRPFDLARGPLLRTLLFRVTETTHVHFVAMHHAVSDGGSLVVLAEELGALYSARVAGVTPALPPLTLQYADYAAWQRSSSPSRHEEELAYWQKQLAGAPPLLALPTDRPRPSVQRFRGASMTEVVPDTIAQAVEAIARAEGATLFSVLLAAFNVLLWRFSGQADVLVGSPVAGRTEPGVERLIGLFLNTLVVRARIDEDAPFRALLGQVRDTVLAALTHQDVPFERVVETLAPVRSTSHAPLFQVMLAFHAPLELPTLPRVRMGLFEVDSGFAKCDLTLSFMRAPSGLTCSFEYNTDLFDAETARRMLGNYLTLLRSIAEDPDRVIGDLSLLTERERDEQCTVRNATAALHDPNVRLETLVERQAERAPNALAVVSSGVELTYAELDRFANRVAHRLRALGVTTDVPVAICTARTAHGIGALLGVLKAGGAYVPLDPLAPTERLRAIIEDSGAPILLCDASVESVRAVLERDGVIVVQLDEPSDDADERTLPAVGHARDIAYIVYTSGSTGRPNGVAVTHASLVNLVEWHRDTYRASAVDRTSHLANPAFDASVWEIWPTLATGGSLHLPPEPIRTSLVELGGWFATTAITRCFLPTPLLEALLATGWPTRGTSLREVLTGGDRLTARPREDLPFRIVNHYGPTECTVVATASVVASTGDGLPPIGRPIANTQAYVLDRKMRLVPVGAPGELYLGGAGLARGYWRNDALTAARFVDSPFGAGKLFRTGDRVRWNHSGELEFLGRTDDQIKIRGYRIEPAEIEATLGRHPLVRESAVIARSVEAGGLALLAYVVPSGPGPDHTLEQALHAFVAEALPQAMRPADYVFLPSLPLTPNGKLDRAALPSVAQGTSARVRIAPRTPLEEQVAALWGEVLAVDRPSMTDTFFAAGGHSLLALRLLARTREVFQVEVPLVDLFSDPTLEAFAGRVGHGRTNAASRAPAVLVPDLGKRYEPFALTDVQEAYWIGRSGEFSLGDVAAQAYVEIDARALDVGRLEAALARLVARHDMLRAIVLPNGTQRALADVPQYRIECVDLRALPQAEIDRELARRREELSHEISAANVYPLWRVRATRWSDDRTRLHIRFDALVADATSMQLLGRELEAFYADPDAELAPLAATFRDYVVAVRADRSSPRRATAEAYWRARIANDLAPAPELPLRTPGDAISPTSELPRFVRRSGELDRAAWQRIKARGAGASLTPASVLMTAFAEVLATFSFSPRFTLNVTLFDRQPLHPDVARMVGDFTALNLLEVDLAQQASFLERSRALQRQLWSDLEHRAASGVWVLRELARARGVAQVPMPVVFTGLLDPDAKPWTPQWGDVVHGIGQTPQVWLDHQTSERDGALVFQWDARDALFPTGLLDEMFDAYRRLLDLLARTDAAWNEAAAIDLVPPSHRATLARVNATEAPLSNELLHGPFLARAAKAPNALAVVSADRRLTYGELEKRARGLAARLTNQGVRPNDRVAIAMEKGWEQIVAVIGTLLAGATYVPIDPALPPLAFEELVSRARVAALVTQARLVDTVGAPGGVPIVAVTATADSIDSPLPSPVRGTDAAYVIFTSGSTGIPKGVEIEHRAAANTIADVNERFGVGDRDRVLALSALSFDLSVYDIFGMLGAGGAIVLPEPNLTRDPEHWAQLVREERITIWNSVPALMAMMLAFDERGRDALGPALRLVMLSGDWVPLDMPAAIRHKCRSAAIVALGGATEAAIWSVLHVIEDVDPRWSSIPYGRPMRNQTLFVLDNRLEERPAWVPGPLFIGGIGLARGYAGDDETTRARFITRPRDGARLYRTGDLGRVWPDGTFEILGREDFQVKIGGERIELGEIEATLRRHDRVRAVVVATVGPKHSARLVAYVVPASTAPSAEELRTFLASRLAASHCPTSYVFVDELPLTANGKIDRARLEATALVPPPRKAKVVHDDRALARLTALVAEVLALPEVDPRADLLSLGIDSLRLVRLGNRLEETYGHRPRMAELFTLRTVGALAGYYATAGAAPPAGSTSSRLLVSAEAREAFKRTHPGVRPLDPQNPGLPLAEREPDVFTRRRSARTFAPQALSSEAFGRLLGSLREVRADDRARRSYPSAGGLYPVQVFLHVKADRIEGIAAGTYYHHPLEHRLVTIAAGATVPPAAHYFVNVPVFDHASFSVFLVGNLDAVEPIYGELARDFCLLEAGAIVQVLMTVAPELGIDLCPIGVMDFERVRPHLAIGDRQLLLHSLLGGAASATPSSWSFLEESPSADPTADTEWERITL